MQTFLRLSIAVALLVNGCRRAPSPKPPTSRGTAHVGATTQRLSEPPGGLAGSRSEGADGGATEPIQLSGANPAFPEIARDRHFSGSMFVFEALIDESGNVGNVRTLRMPKITPPTPEVEQACIAAIRAWKYRPATFRGKPVPALLTVSVNINLR